MIEKLGIAGILLTAVLIKIAILVIAPILGLLLGAFSGWLAGYFFPVTMTIMIKWFGLSVAPWQFGLMLGFIGGFFRSYQYNSKT